MFLTNFAYDSHFTELEKSGTKISSHTPEEFIDDIFNKGTLKSYSGYSDFCNIQVFKNFTDATSCIVEIDENNYSDINSRYVKRRKDEPPFLTRTLEIDGELPIAKYLHVVVYDYPQLELEQQENKDPRGIVYGKSDKDNVDYFGIVAILAQNTIEQQPMQPHTYLRNTLPRKHG